MARRRDRERGIFQLKASSIYWSNNHRNNVQIKMIKTSLSPQLSSPDVFFFAFAFGKCRTVQTCLLPENFYRTHLRACLGGQSTVLCFERASAADTNRDPLPTVSAAGTDRRCSQHLMTTGFDIYRPCYSTSSVQCFSQKSQILTSGFRIRAQMTRR